MAKGGSRRGRPRGARAGGRSRAGGSTRSGAQAAATDTLADDAQAQPARVAPDAARTEKRTRRRARAAAMNLAEQAPLGERPQAPWHPLPLSEILIFVGLVAGVIGATRSESGLPIIGAGVLAILLGTLDFTAREHLSGYRPHTTMLAAVPTALVFAALVVVMRAVHVPSPLWVIVPLAIAVPLFMFLFSRLRSRFRDARHQRVLAAGR